MEAPRVLLVYANPAVTATPVGPYGMEKVAHAFAIAGCQTRMVAPFIEADPGAFFRENMAWEPDLVGFSVRNIDDALVVRSAEGPDHGEGAIDTRFYLDEVRPLVAVAVEAVGPERVLLGGPGLSSGPEEVLVFLGASRAVVGPADDLCWRLGRALARGEGPLLPEDPRVVGNGPRGHGFGRSWQAPPGTTPRLGPYLGLTLARGGRVAVQISGGCDRRCRFCVEARFLGSVVVPRPVEQVIDEIEVLAGVGVDRFWLAGSELNVPDDRHAIEIFRRIAAKKLAIELYGFVQPAPVSDALLDAMQDAGLDPATLSFEFGHFDDGLLRQGAGPANRAQIDRLVETFLRRGHRQLGGSILLGAHPEETDASVQAALDAALSFDAALPDGFGLSYATGGRVYPNSPLGDWVRGHREEAAPDLYGSDDPSFVRPVVFCRPGSPRGLMRRVQEGLAGARGNMGPMNAEAPAQVALEKAEALVNRGIWRLHQDRPQDAERCFSEALDLWPDHLEGLAQLSLVLANQLGDMLRARSTLTRLRDALAWDDPRRDAVLAQLHRLDG